MSEREAKCLVSLWILHPLLAHMQSHGHLHPKNKTITQILWHYFPRSVLVLWLYFPHFHLEMLTMTQNQEWFSRRKYCGWDLITGHLRRASKVPFTTSELCRAASLHPSPLVLELCQPTQGQAPPERLLVPADCWDCGWRWGLGLQQEVLGGWCALGWEHPVFQAAGWGADAQDWRDAQC